jgi:hypothetical protein
VLMLDGKSKQSIAAEKTQLAQTKAKPTSLNALSKDKLVNQTLQAGVSTATWEAATHSGSSLGSTAIGQAAGSIFGGALGQRKQNPTLTFVWALASPASQTISTSNAPSFVVSIAGFPGVHPEEYAPLLVKLTPTPNNWRLVGATEGKQDAMGNSEIDWPVYSSFVEDQLPAQTKKLASGRWQISPANPLSAGEYAIVLRPVSKNKKFAGQEISANKGDGLLFNSVWSFAIK